MLNCWKTKPIDRPTFTDLKETLLEMWSECTGYEAAEVTELPTCVTQGSLTSTTESNGMYICIPRYDNKEKVVES